MTDREKRRRMKELARDLVRNSIIEDALVQFVAQMVEYIHDERIAGVKAENANLRAILDEIKSLAIGSSSARIRYPLAWDYFCNGGSK